MSKQTIFIGTTANDRTGDPLRTAFQKVNENFDELYTLTQSTTGDISFLNNNLRSLSGVVVDNSDSSHGATASVIVPSNGSQSQPVSLTNIYGHVKINCSPAPGTPKTWSFNSDGTLSLPVGGDIVDSNGTSVLGGGGTSLSVITPDDIEISNVATLVFTGAGVTASSAGNAVTLDITGGSANTGDFTFTNGTASLPPGNTMTLQTYQSGGNRESVLTLIPTGDSALDVGGGLRVRTAYGTGFEKSWTFNTDGSITFPDATTQSTAYTGDVANTRTNGSGYVTLAGGVTDVIYTIQPWMVSSKLVICVESEVDSDGTFTKHTQTCEATIAATYNYTNEPVISVYGLVYTSPNPLATFSTRRGAGNVIEVVAANIQGTKIATFSIHAIQFISTHD